MRRRAEVPESSDLPADLAAGPDPRVWDPVSLRPTSAGAAWHAAGNAWSQAHGLGPNGWLSLLPADVRYAVSARGRHHISCGGFIPPWKRDRPLD